MFKFTSYSIKEEGVKSNKSKSSPRENIPPQRKTTLKWGSDGELSSIDMTRILERLSHAELTECDLTCPLDELK